MSNETTPPEEPVSDTAGEPKLRGAESAHDHCGRNPDTKLHLDGEKDTLYSDGIDVDEELDTWAGTDGSLGRIP
jgi:hypothetical protein